MQLKIISIALIILAFNVSATAQEKASEKLFMAKFLLIRLAPAGLTQAQLDTIEAISFRTRERLLSIQERTGISKEVMHHRDEVFNQLRDVNRLKGEKLLAATAEKAKLNPLQQQGFAESAAIAPVFRKSVMALLTPEQRILLKEAEKKNKNHQGPPPPFKTLPLDKDGLIRSNKIPGLNRDVFEHVDQDIDGKLSEQEYRWYEKRSERIKKNRIQIPPKTKRFLELEYVENGHERHRLDLYLPENVAEGQRIPLVIYVHGGGWQKGSKQEVGGLSFLLNQGFAVASVNYRLSRHAAFPAQIHDCKAAVRFLRKHADEYSLAPDKFGILGPSAGGHLASLLGTSGGAESMEGTLGNPEVSSSVQAVCDWFGAMDFITMNEAIKHSDKRVKPVTLLLGHTVEENPERARWASPVTHITEDDPPFLIMHGTADEIVPIQQSEQFYEALRARSVPAEYIIVPDWKHSFFRQQSELDKVAEFFSKTLRSQK